MIGPLLLSELDSEIKVVSPGVFILSHDGESFDLLCRADTDIYSTMKFRWRITLGYKYYWYELTPDTDSAFYLECEWYHKFQPGDNLLHPYSPENKELKCPIKKCLWES